MPAFTQTNSGILAVNRSRAEDRPAVARRQPHRRTVSRARFRPRRRPGRQHDVVDPRSVADVRGRDDAWRSWRKRGCVSRARGGSRETTPMNSTRALTFLATPWTVAVAVLAWLVVAGLEFHRLARSGYRASIAVLECLRLAILAIVGVLLNQPEWVETFRPNEKPSIAVLWDASASMATRDVVAANSTDGVPGHSPGSDRAARLATKRGNRCASGSTSSSSRSPNRESGSGTDISTPLTAAAEKLQFARRRGAHFRRRLERRRAARRGGRAAADWRTCPSSPSRSAARNACRTSNC